MNELICYVKDNEQKWDMVKKKDARAFLLSLFTDKDVDNDTIFIIPTNMVNGIWLCSDKHKSNRVDFFHFFDDFGCSYERPVVSEEVQKVSDDMEDKNGDDTKYGYISPDGRYFHCSYQGHNALASNICFGMVDTNNCEKYLEEHGWCKIYKPLGDSQYSVYVGGKHVITREQMKTLTKMGLDDAQDLSKMLLKD